jgi:hypothetical protein
LIHKIQERGERLFMPEFELLVAARVDKPLELFIGDAKAV